jgi:hypothetical protein
MDVMALHLFKVLQISGVWIGLAVLFGYFSFICDRNSLFKPFKTFRISSRVFMVLIALAGLLTACSSQWLDDWIGEPPVTPQPSQAALPIWTPLPTPVVLNIMDLSVGLDALASYRIDFTTTFEFVELSGEEIRRMIRYQYYKLGDERAYTMRVSDTDDPTVIFQQSGLYQKGNKSYQIYGTELVPTSCTYLTDEKAAQLHDSRFTPVQATGVLTELHLTEENVAMNGILTDYFAFDQTNQTLVDYYASVGEVWVSQSEGFIVRLSGQGQGLFNLVGYAGDGVVAWEYLLSEVNTLEAIVLPEICEMLGIEGILLPDEAEIINEREGFISFTSPGSPEEVAAFCREAYPLSGWTLALDEITGETYVLTFAQGDRTIYMTISLSEDQARSLTMITE